tara:strand:- start:4374 stop:5648 length:1275 start_codon:yes stop_codon:yes gene_type:complete
MQSHTISISEAKALDAEDPLSGFRKKFIFPQHNGKDALYFTGNSLGLQPKAAKYALQIELDDWGEHGVEGHFRARNPWMHYHELLSKNLADIVGAKPSEVVAMNALTVNLHLLLVSFYSPKDSRKKIICEANAFPSDRYALLSQIEFHGGNPETDLIEIEPREGENLILLEDVLSAIEEAGDELKTVMMGGINYYTGQLHNIEAITNAAHEVGAFCGFDLAHAAGNVPLNLHDLGIDFACWCTYKYMNSGPGSVGGIFIHEKHHNSRLPRLEGWWGHDKETRFKMTPDYISMGTAESWQMSNAPIFNMAIHNVSLNIFKEAGGMEVLRERSLRLTDYLEQTIGKVVEATSANLEIITPCNHDNRGCQLSVVAHGQGRELFDTLSANGVIVDWRDPAVIRMAPVPLYNSFEDIARFGLILQDALN